MSEHFIEEVGRIGQGDEQEALYTDKVVERELEQLG